MASSDEINIREYLFEYTDSIVGDPQQISANRWINSSAEENIDIEQRTLDQIFGNYCFEIPEYQRGFSWKEKHYEDLWSEIEPLFEDDIPRFSISDTFFGSMFFAEIDTDPDSGRDILEVIDGQQRITTVSLILKIISEELESLDENSLNKDLKDIVSRYSHLADQCLFNDIGASDPDPAVTLNGHNKCFYNSLVKKGHKERINYIEKRKSVHGNRRNNAIKIDDYLSKLRVSETAHDLEDDNVSFKETNKRLLDAYDFFRTRFSNNLPDDPNQRARSLINTYRYLLKSFIVGRFTVDQSQPSLLMEIFQVLNDRGMDLNKVEIIRARLVTCFRQDGVSDDVAEEYIQKWETIVNLFDVDYDTVSDLLVDYITTIETDVNTRSDVADDLLAAFMVGESLDGAAIDSRLEDIETATKFLDDLKDYAEYYHNLVYPYDDGVSLRSDSLARQCNDIIRRLSLLRTKQWRPLALGIYGAVKSQQGADESYLLDALKTIENITLRQVLAGLNPNRMDTIYATVVHDFDGNLDFSIQDELAKEFRDTYSGADGRSFAKIINEEADLSNHHAKALLWRITAELDWGGAMWEQQLKISDTHLEHVFPQEPILSNNKYWWFNNFFRTHEDEDVPNLIEELIDEGEDEALREIAESYFTNDLANLCLLWHKDNISGGNRPFTEKLPIFLESDGFCKATINEYFCPDSLPTDEYRLLVKEYRRKRSLEILSEDNWDEISDKYDFDAQDEDAVREELTGALNSLHSSAEYQEASSEIAGYWTDEALLERKQELLDLILESLQFDEDEFQDFDVNHEVAEEINTRKNILFAENERIIS